MNHTEITELLGAYALDAVDGDERVAIEDHLPGCARCRAEVAEHREVASLLAHEGGQAPEGVWQRIAGTLEAPPPDLRLAPVPPPSAPSADRVVARRWSPSRRTLGLVAAAAAVALVLLGGQIVRQGDRIDRLEVALEDPLTPALQAALDDPDASLLELGSADGGIELRGAITPDGVGYLRAGALPPLDAGRTYQLWGATGSELVSLGVLGADPGVVSFAADGYEGFAITEEDAPGVVAPTSEPLVSS